MDAARRILTPPASEGDVVFRAPAAAGRGGRGGLQVGLVDRHVAAGLESVPVAPVVAGAQELDRVGDDLDRLALPAVLGLPLAPLQAPVDRDRAALGQEAGAILSLRAPDGDAE